MTTITIPATKARENLFDLLEKLSNPAVQITITYKGEPRAVLINAEEFDSRQETMEILADKELMADIKTAQQEYKKGEYLTFEDIFGKTPSQVLHDRVSHYRSKKSRKAAK